MQLFERKSQLGDRNYASSAVPVRTNDLGMYRFGNLPPGRYYVLALAQSDVNLTATSMLGNATSEPKIETVTTFFGDAKRFSEAATVQVADSQTVREINIRCLAEKTSRLVGVTRSLVTGDPIKNVGVGAFPINTAGEVEPAASANSRSDQKGQFIMNRLPNGRYLLVAYLRGDAGMQSGLAEVDITGKPDQTVTVDIGGFDVQYKVDIVRSQGEARVTPDLKAIRLVLSAETFSPRAVASTPPSITGEGKLEGVAPGRHRFRVTGIPEGWFLRGLTVGQQDILNGVGVIAINDSSTIVSLSLAPTSASISGTVKRASGGAIDQAIVFLVPRTNVRRYDLYKRAYADEGGKFMITAIAPGLYSLAAFEDVNLQSMFDTGFMEYFSSRELKVRVETNGSQTFDLTPVPADAVAAFENTRTR